MKEYNDMMAAQWTRAKALGVDADLWATWLKAAHIYPDAATHTVTNAIRLSNIINRIMLNTTGHI